MLSAVVVITTVLYCKVSQSCLSARAKYTYSLNEAIFFPRVILYIFFLFWLIYGGLGFWGWGFQLMGFGTCGVGPSGFFGLGLSI